MNEWTRKNIVVANSSTRFTVWVNLLITVERLELCSFDVNVERDVKLAGHPMKQMIVWVNDFAYAIYRTY